MILNYILERKKIKEDSITKMMMKETEMILPREKSISRNCRREITLK